MIFSKRCTDYFDKHVTEHISYVISQCVTCNSTVSLRGVSKYDTHNIYYFEANVLPSFTFLNMLSIYFDSMTIDVNKELVVIKLTIDFNKDIPF